MRLLRQVGSAHLAEPGRSVAVTPPGDGNLAVMGPLDNLAIERSTPTQRPAERRHVGVALILAWLVVSAAVGMTATGARHAAVPLGPTEPIAQVAGAAPRISDDPLALPDDPMAWRSWPDALTTTVQTQPIPAFVGLDDPPGPGPALAVDPAVARLLAQLRDEANGSPTQARPAPEALVALDFALAQVGRPYVWGATGPDSYDCSGLTMQSYAQAGFALPRVAADQHAYGGAPVAVAALLPGDLVFFATAAWDPGAVHHVGMYVGRGLMVDAPHPGAYVRVEPITAAGYVGAVRVVTELAGTPTSTSRPNPTDSPSAAATPGPTGPPSEPPTPSITPTISPSIAPEPAPSDLPTPAPSATPTAEPTSEPTTAPTAAPTPDPSTDPTTEPTPDPTTDPPSPTVSSDSPTAQGSAPPSN